MTKTPARVRRSALEATNGCCAICGAYLAAQMLDVHHVLHRAAGGGDDADNLVALCPTCHRSFPHGYYDLTHLDIVRKAVQRGKALATLDRKVASAGSATDVLGILAAREVRVLAVATGQYQRILTPLGEAATASERFGRLGDRTSGLAVVRLAELSAYGGRDADTLRFGAIAKSFLERLEPEDPDSTAAAVAVARFLRATGDVRDEVELMESARAVDLVDVLEVNFRLGSALIHRGSPDRAALVINAALARWDATPHPSDETVMLLASLHGDVGEVFLRRRETALAIEPLKAAFGASHSVFHARGMYVSSLRLCHAYEAIGELDQSLAWFAVAGGLQWIANAFDSNARFNVHGTRLHLLRALDGAATAPKVGAAELRQMMRGD